MSKTKKIILFIIIIACALLAVYGYRHWQYTRYQLTDEDRLEAVLDSVSEQLSSFESNSDYLAFLKKAADEAGLDYTSDEAGNFVITLPASKGHKKDKPTVILTEYDYTKASDQIYSVSTMKYLSENSSNSGKTHFVFLANNANTSDGIRALSSGYLPANSAVICLSDAKKMNIIRSSHVMATETVNLPLSMTDRTCDTAVRLNIRGISKAPIGSDISGYPNPLTQLSALMTWLNSKSITYELSGIKLHSEGNLYPDAMQATVLIKSYSLADLQKQLDKMISSAADKYEKKNPDLDFSYKVIENKKRMPDKVYTKETVEALNTFLYTAVNGNYSFNEKDEIPEGYSEGDSYAVNCIRGYQAEGSSISLYIYTTAVDKAHLDRVLKDNRTAAGFVGASISDRTAHPSFDGDEALSEKLSTLYRDTNHGAKLIPVSAGKKFYGTSYISERFPDVKAAHLTESEKTYFRITNMLMNYLNGSEAK